MHFMGKRDDGGTPAPGPACRQNQVTPSAPALGRSPVALRAHTKIHFRLIKNLTGKTIVRENRFEVWAYRCVTSSGDRFLNPQISHHGRACGLMEQSVHTAQVRRGEGPCSRQDRTVGGGRALRRQERVRGQGEKRT